MLGAPGDGVDAVRRIAAQRIEVALGAAAAAGILHHYAVAMARIPTGMGINVGLRHPLIIRLSLQQRRHSPIRPRAPHVTTQRGAVTHLDRHVALAEHVGNVFLLCFRHFYIPQSASDIFLQHATDVFVQRMLI